MEISKNGVYEFSCDGSFKVVVNDGKFLLIPEGCFIPYPPEFVHDCERCIYLGYYYDNNVRYELYYHRTTDADNMYETLIARFGNEGHEYKSGKEFVGIVKPITEAYKRAVKFGFMNEIKKEK